jgi:hypothetical protein
VLAAVLLALGLIFPYIEMWKHQGRVVGLSFRFLAVDFAGAFFSLLALAMQHKFDELGGASYISVMILEIGIVVCHLIWLWRTRHIRAAAKKAGKDYDEYVSSMNADDNITKRSFVRIEDVPNWPKTAWVSAILSALYNTSAIGDEEKHSSGTSEQAFTQQMGPKAVQISTIIAAMSQPSREASMAGGTTLTESRDSQSLTTTSVPITVPPTAQQSHKDGVAESSTRLP